LGKLQKLAKSAKKWQKMQEIAKNDKKMQKMVLFWQKLIDKKGCQPI